MRLATKGFVQQLRALSEVNVSEVSDSELIERYLQSKNPDVFELIVRQVSVEDG